MIFIFSSFLLFLNIGGSELFFILLMVLLLFGSKRIPELARGLGKGLRQMRDAASGVEQEITREIKEIEKETDVKKITEE